MNDPIVTFHSQIRGRYRLRASLEDGTVTKDTGWFDNLILDQGLNQIGQSTNSGVSFGEPILWAVGCVGTGTTAPTTADTQLEAWLASAGNYSGYTRTWVTGAEPYWKCIHTFRFGTGAAAGNLTEVGVGDTHYDGTGLFSRALIVDGGGSPTTLTVTASEILDLTYEFRVYPDTTTRIQVLNIGGTDYTFTWDLYNPSSNIPLINYSYINGSGDFSSCRVVLAQTTSGGGGSRSIIPTSTGYSAGTYFRSYTGSYSHPVAYWGSTIGSISITTLHMVQLGSISPLLPITSVQDFSITFNVSWDRFTP
jgi:hypothetical protein